ncbi:MAG: glucose-6-phosphate dehydrogenase [Oligoflexia bacterium]|nr:glucose-6-phosphate dehydrogenase [Oligoflexia bacterium]
MTAASCIFVIFGGNGDLARRLLIPALYNMSEADQLPERYEVIGTGRAPLTDEQYRESVKKALQLKKSRSSAALDEFTAHFHYFIGDMSQVAPYAGLKRLLEQAAKNQGFSGSVVFYLATPPDLFCQIPPLLKSSGLLEQAPGAWRRVVIEKPFGHDLNTARELNRILLDAMNEDQIYRIDHFLGKRMVQSILPIRFANTIFEPLWNRNYIRSVQITAAETLGVEKRANYYDQAGALRDMVPNHMMQVTALLGMEPPNSLRASDVQSEKLKLIRAITPFDERTARANAVRGQYTQGKIGGITYPAYRSEPGVKPDSTTETFAALKLSIDNWRWSGVPFYLQTGKRMAFPLTQIVIEFNSAPTHPLPQNLLTLKIQPDPLISLTLATQATEGGHQLRQARICFNYDENLKQNDIGRTGYENLLSDLINGDATHFQSAEQAEAAWGVVQPALDFWEENPSENLEFYPAGSLGPVGARRLPEREGRHWLLLESAPAAAPPLGERAA